LATSGLNLRACSVVGVSTLRRAHSKLVPRRPFLSLTWFADPPQLRVYPEDIIVNIGEDAPVPVPNCPGKWKEVIHDNTVTWLATWTENINGNHKYVFLAAGSSLKGQSDMSKFEKSRELKVSICARFCVAVADVCLIRIMSNASVRITRRI